MTTGQRVRTLFARHDAAMLDSWLEAQKRTGIARPDLIDESQRREESGQILILLDRALSDDPPGFPDDASWDALRMHLEQLAESRAVDGFSPTEIAHLVLTLKPVVFERLRGEQATSPTETWADIEDINRLLDGLALFTIEVLQRSREAIISRQQQNMLELSTPVVTLWDGILGLPLIGTLDSRRARQVMETLLARIAETQSSVAIIDISGVPTVDTLTAQYLTRTAAAVRLMGAECIVSGIRPQIARTLIDLDVELGELPTRATLAGALALAFERVGRSVIARD